MYKIDKTISKKMEEAIIDGYYKADALWTIKHNITFILTKGKSRNGYCRKIKENDFQIAINKDLVKKQNMIEVVVHEILHSYPDVWEESARTRKIHSGEWAKRAAIVNKAYNMKVQRTNSFERSTTYTKLLFECTSCHHLWSYAKTPRWYSIISQVTCPYCKTSTIKQVPLGTHK